MEGDDRKRPHSSSRDHGGWKASRPDREEGRRNDRDRSHDRGERTTRDSDRQAESRRHGNGSRDGYPSHGRGGHHSLVPVVRNPGSRDAMGSPGDRPRRQADEHSSSEGRRGYSRERSGRPGEEHTRREGHGGRERSSRVGEEPEVRRERTDSTGSSGSQGSAVFRPPPSPNGSADSRGGLQFREPPSPNQSSASRGPHHSQDPSSPVVSSGSRGRGFSREPPKSPNEVPIHPGQQRSTPADRSRPDDGWPENQGGEFSGSRRASDESSNDRDGTSSRPLPTPPSRNITESSPQSLASPTGSSSSRDGGFSQPVPSTSSAVRGRGFSRDGPPGPRPDGPGLQARLQNYATHSTVDVNDPTQDRPGGRRGARPPRPSDAQLADFVRTRPENLNKKAQAGRTVKIHSVELYSNYYRMDSRHKWRLYRYHVDFEPEVEKTFTKRALFKPHAPKMPGWHLFDGSALYTAIPLPAGLLQLYSALEREEGDDESENQILIKINPEPKVIDERDPINIQIYNIIIRNCMQALGLCQIGRNYYNYEKAIDVPEERLTIWPGYKTSIRQHENELLLCVEMTNKVLRLETALDVILGHRGDREAAKNELLGCVVMTKYNKRTYRIDDINWDESPLTTFKMGKRDISFVEYFREKYPEQGRIRNTGQPVLYSKAKRKDVRRGMCRNIGLIPELCLMTGLKDKQRNNPSLMSKLKVHLQMNPEARVSHIQGFSRLLQDKEVTRKVLAPAGLRLGTELVKLTGHIFEPEVIGFGGDQQVQPKVDRYDWGGVVGSKHMVSTVPLINWAVINTRNGANTSTFLRMVKNCAYAMGFTISESYMKFEADDHTRSYIEQIENIMRAGKDTIQMIMCVLPKDDENLYGEIKRKCYLDYGVPSQCVLSTKVTSPLPHVMKGVATKLAIQMNTKLGGVPWRVRFHLSGLMTVGFNISAMGRQRGSNARRSVGALVASLNKQQSQYFSCIVDQEDGQTLCTLLGVKIVQALNAYATANNGDLPTKIIFYRDGMGDGQLQSVVDTEVQEIKSSYTEIYKKKGVRPPAFVFIVVNKRLNTKFFVRGNGRGYSNPSPGTCVDDVVTLPERYDFYLISAKGTGQGTLSPTGYNVIHDELKLAPEQIQQLTHKLCHMYFNWTSTVGVPAPCQYAHKLAFLQNLMNKTGRREQGSSEPKPQLCNTLFYL